MSAPRCSRCKAELLPEVNFCRQCGAAVTPGNRRNCAELPATGFDQSLEESPTKRLEVRTISPNRAVRENVESPGNISDRPTEGTRRKRRRPVALILAAIVVLALVVIAWAGLVRPMRQTMMATANTDSLVYPGSRTIVDTTTEDGRAIHLQTGDSLDQVVAWYTTNLKPTKTMRITPSTIVLKNQNITTTVVAEDNTTNILIKQAR